MPKYRFLQFGPLPHDLVNRTLGTELLAGNVILTSLAHQHIAEDHPTDYPIVLSHLEETVINPGYIGQSPHHGAEFEMVRRVLITANSREIVLIALSLERNRFGNYNVHSGYRLREEQVVERIKKGHLIIPKNKALS